MSIQDHHLHHHRLLLGIEPAPIHTNKTREGYSNEANFDTNMVIILAALLCALICVLGLNSIVRCALRCGRRMAFETPDEAAARLAATGLKKRALRQIPVTVYGSGVSAPGSPADCPICLGEFMDGEKVRVLPKCKHEFHVRCIDTWLTSHSSCPTCRSSLLDRPVAAVTLTELEAGNRSPGVGSSSRQEVIAGDEVS
ncbi:RING-H2 finger protein ATL74-like [Aristolochia californica]|uniref:RING-H2 finger protein ATL74-like n=1 Tax=Aristolochia californica TaxID=171875 RepID=UPI0035D88936